MIRSLILSAVWCVLVLTAPGTDAQGRCVNPHGISGVCISIYVCDSLKALLETRPLTSEMINYLQQSQCEGTGEYPTVCCTNENMGASAAQRDSTGDLYNYDNNELLPANCGKDLTQRIFGGNVTALDEFPWMALLEYAKQGRRGTLCGGVLISSRYVLTAAHCLSKARIQDWRLVGVRLGEYNLDTNPDCFRSEDKMVCADEPISVGIEEQFVHESYEPASADQKYDIGLIRLNRNVRMGTYIKPICLPRNAEFGDNLHVAGWGRTETGYGSPVKLKLIIPLSDQQQCSDVYRRQNIGLGFGQVCAGGKSGQDTCRGDSGGPLMSFQRVEGGNGRWTCVGIVSFGPDPCGTENWPGVYTRVIDYVPWILGKMRA